MKAFKKTGGRKMIHLCMEKNVELCKIYLNWFQIFDQILDQNLDQRVAHTTQQINSTSHKNKSFFKNHHFFSFNSFFNWFLWFSTFFLSHSYFLMILRIQHIRFLGGIREIKGGIFCFLTPTIFLFTFEFSSQRLDSWANNPQHLIQK